VNLKRGPLALVRLSACLKGTSSMSGIMHNVSDITEKDNDDDLSPMQVFIIVYLVVVFLVGVSVNTSLLLTFFRKSSLRTTSNRLVVFL